MLSSKLALMLVTLVVSTSMVVAENCVFVETGFVSMPCGKAPTDAELKKFFVDSAAKVAKLKADKPCGFTTCPGTPKAGAPKAGAPKAGAPKVRRVVDFTYSTRDVVTEPVGEVEERDLDDLTEEELIERNLPVMRGDDGVLRLYGRGTFPTPQTRDTIDELHERINRGEVESEQVALDKRNAVAVVNEERDFDFDITDEGELISRNLPMASDGDGKLYLFGSR